QVVRPVTALVVVDVQNDFITGSLNLSNCPAGHDGAEVISPVNKLVEEIDFDAVVYSLDWHPTNHISFIDNIHLREIHPSCSVTHETASLFDVVTFQLEDRKQDQKMWPRHCVQDTWGAELHKDLKIHETAVFVKKGTVPDTDSYSVFWDNNKMTHTSLNDDENGYRTILLEDACRGVSEEDIAITKANISANHGIIVNSSQVSDLLNDYL
ncbi:UNVERIFIED_CONTAM: hypothetical protein GTU68_021528, partial [Idotea baltica]|nr:hypothetical protein [Idotea baltica]